MVLFATTSEPLGVCFSTGTGCGYERQDAFSLELQAHSTLLS
jgi:hypothetical protein